MKKVLLATALAMSVSAIAGCAPRPPSQVEISSANYGQLPADYQSQIKNYFNTVLKDPESARYTFQPTFKGYSQNGSLATNPGMATYGYVTPVLVNAKNSYGGYTGNQSYAFLFSGGVMYDVTQNFTFGLAKRVQ